MTHIRRIQLKRKAEGLCLRCGLVKVKHGVHCDDCRRWIYSQRDARNVVKAFNRMTVRDRLTVISAI